MSPLRIFAWIWHRLAPSIPIRRNLDGVTVFFDLRDNPYYVLARASRLQMRELEFLPERPCRVWDVGCNVGLFALSAARRGHQVIAFDLSPKALRYLRRGCNANKLEVTIVERALTVRPCTYTAPHDCHTENRLKPGLLSSLTWREAEREYGRPDVIKMDIEGGEFAFLESREFLEWILTHRIRWIVESHSHLVWPVHLIGSQ